MHRHSRRWVISAAALGAALAGCSGNGNGPATLPYLLLSPLVDSVFTGDTLSAPAVTYYDAQGHPQSAGTVRWSTSAPSIASVDSVTGVVHGIARGFAVVTASARGTQGSALVIVSRPLDVERA